jgi:hypothetical protein
MVRPDAEGLIYGTFRPADPVVYHYADGHVLGDLIGTTMPGRYLISDRVVEVLKAGGFKGWLVYPVRIVVDESNQEIPGYHGLSITGRCGPPDDSQSSKVREGHFIKLRGLYLDDETWDGSDIFLVEGTLYICLTAAVYDAIVSLNPKTLRLIPLDEAKGTVIARES